jgi:hypothetical protein
MNGHGISEDLLSLVIALVIFILALGLLGGVDLLGWVVTTGVWTDPSKALAPMSKAYAGLGGVGALVATYAGLLVLMTAGAAALRRGTLRPRFHRGILDQLPLLDRRQLRQFRSEHAGRYAEIRH